VSPGVSYFVQRKDETGREYYLNSTPQHLQTNRSAVPVRPFISVTFIFMAGL
jgi:hypothetical protein